MSTIYHELARYCEANAASLVAVSKTKPTTDILKMYQLGQRIFGENRVQELVDKHASLPKDIDWHMIGHLQTNKVKYIIPFISMIHSGDRMSLLKEVNKQARKSQRNVDVLLQVKIAQEDSKYGWDSTELIEELKNETIQSLDNINVRGLMGMATFTSYQDQVKSEFLSLKSLYTTIKDEYYSEFASFDTLSMGMSGDYKMAIAAGSNMIRVGSLLFGIRG